MDWPTVADLVDRNPWYKNRGVDYTSLVVVKLSEIERIY